MSQDSSDVLNRVDAQRAAFLEELSEYLRIPSISTDPEYQPHVERCCDWLLERMCEAGLETEKIEGDGNPLAYGEWLGAESAPTILFYGHYDVQPVDPLELWRNPPFEPTLEGKNLVARGATDDKGQSFAHLKAVAAMMAERGRLPVNVKFLVEGEEESGGEAIDKYVRQDGGKRLAADAVVISDSSMMGPGQPSLIYGLRGLAYVELKVSGPNRDLHSGTYGGAVQNPLNALATIISRLHDVSTGRILIPGFYDDVRELEAWEREEIAALPFDERGWAAAIGLEELYGEGDYSTLERTGARPTLDVNGIFGGYQGAGAKTVLPAWGGAKVSMRLVPDQDPGDIVAKLRRYIDKIKPRGVEVEVKGNHGAKPVLVDASGAVVDAAMDALEDVWGKRPVRIREGGSIPIVSTFADVLGCPVMLAGFGLPDDALHAPNEKFHVDHFHNGIRTIVRLLDRVGAAG